MAVFPKIQRPCPYADRLASIMEGDACRMCHRQVFDLTEMDDGQRLAFLAGCSGEICISYRAPVRIALAAMAASAAVAIPMAAAACDVTDITVVVGGIRDAAHTEFVQDAGDAAIPVLPVVYDDASKAAAPTAPVAAKPAASQGAETPTPPPAKAKPLAGS